MAEFFTKFNTIFLLIHLNWIIG